MWRRITEGLVFALTVMILSTSSKLDFPPVSNVTSMDPRFPSARGSRGHVLGTVHPHVAETLDIPAGPGP